MGSSTSKASRAAAGAAARKYPSRPSPATQAPPSAAPQATPRALGPTNRPSPHASSTRDETINLDASDPQYAANLRQIGIVQPNPFFSPPTSDPHETMSSYRPPPSSAASSGPSTASAPAHAEPPPNFFPSSEPNSNPALRILQARQQLQDEAERELDNIGRRGFEGRKFLDAGSIRDAIALREAGVSREEIEKRLGMKKGRAQKLGAKGIVANIV